MNELYEIIQERYLAQFQHSENFQILMMIILTFTSMFSLPQLSKGIKTCSKSRNKQENCFISLSLALALLAFSWVEIPQ